MKGFENFTADERKVIDTYAEIVPSVRVETTRSGRKTYVIGTYEEDYKFRSKKAFLEAIRTTLREWELER